MPPVKPLKYNFPCFFLKDCSVFINICMLNLLIEILLMFYKRQSIEIALVTMLLGLRVVRLGFFPRFRCFFYTVFFRIEMFWGGLFKGKKFLCLFFFFRLPFSSVYRSIK